MQAPMHLVYNISVSCIKVTAGFFVRYCDIIEQTKEELEDYISSYMEILDDAHNQGLLKQHPEEVVRIHNLNMAVSTVQITLSS